MKKQISLILLAALLCNLAACGSSGGASDTDAGADTTAAPTESTTTAEPLPELEVKDFGGHVITVLTREDSTQSVAWNCVDLVAPEQNGEVVNDAVHRRNSAVMERYNIGIERLQVANESFPAQARSVIMANDDTYDLLLGRIDHQATLSTEGLLHDMEKLPHLDFSYKFWDRSTMADLSYNGRTYFALGDINITDNDATWSIMFNKNMAEDYSSIPNLYELVESGAWTIDKLQEFGHIVTEDLDGNGTMEWESDKFGLIDQNECVLAFYNGAGLQTFARTSDGSFEYQLSSETHINALNRIYEVFSDLDFQLNADHYTMDDKWNILSRGTFKAGRALFLMMPLSAIRLIRDMEDDFGILPTPKLDASQERYRSTMQYGNATAYSIPKSTGDAERSALILEALCAESLNTLTPAYYEMTLKRKASRDSESAAMLDLILENRVFDMGLVFGTVGAAGVLKDIFKATSNVVVSKEAAMRNSITKNFQKVLDTYDKLD